MRILTALILVALTGPALADAFSNADVARYWRKHDEAKKAVYVAFATGAPVAEYSQPMLDLIRWESQLMFTGLIRGDDQRLVAGLAKAEGFTLQSQYDYPVLVYRIFEREFARQSGYTPNPAELFDWASMKVQSR